MTHSVSDEELSRMSITTRLIVVEAQSRGYGVEVLDAEWSLLRMHIPDRQPLLMKNVLTRSSSGLGIRIADDKNATYIIAEHVGVPIPETESYTDIIAAESFLALHGTIVVKPDDQAHGDGVTIGIRDALALKRSIKKAQEFSDSIVLQKHAEGEDVRILFVGDEYVAAAVRKPARVYGDGENTIHQLIELENSQAHRAPGYDTKYCEISVRDAVDYLGEDSMERVPSKNEEVRVIGPANVGKGGEAIDITHTIHESVLVLARTIYEACEMSIGGIDFMVANPTKEVTSDNQAYLIEVNAMPTFGLHHMPHEGQSVDVASIFIDQLLKK